MGQLANEPNRRMVEGFIAVLRTQYKGYRKGGGVGHMSKGTGVRHRAVNHHVCHLTPSHTVTMGWLPPMEALPTLPPMPVVPAVQITSATIDSATTTTPAAVAAGSVMSLLFPQAELVASKQAKVWVGDGLPAIPKKLHTRILNWECIDLAELRPVGRAPLDKMNPVPDPQHFIIMPGMEVTRATKKSMEDILTWVQCFTTYVAILSTKFPEAVPDLMTYMLSIIRAYQEYERIQGQGRQPEVVGNRQPSLQPDIHRESMQTSPVGLQPIAQKGAPLQVHLHGKGWQET